jgi:hypothetical protein
MVRSRVYGILAGYEDQNDHDTLRHDLRWRRKSSCGRGGSWCGSHQAAHTWIGIVGCASACVPPSRFPFPIPLADRWTARRGAFPRWGEGGGVPTRPVQAEVP